MAQNKLHKRDSSIEIRKAKTILVPSFQVTYIMLVIQFGNAIKPLLIFAVLFFLVAHAMESTILPLEMVWEHRNYLPSVALCLLVAVCLDFALRKIRTGLAATLIGALFILLVANLWLRADRWTDELLLSQINVVNHPQSLRSNYRHAATG